LGARAKGQTEGVAERLVGVMAHPIRLEALRIFYYRVASTTEVAKELGESFGVVYHHVNDLRERGLIEEVRAEPKGGSVEHFYRGKIPTHFSDAAWARLPLTAREEISGLVLQAIWGEILRALRERTFDSLPERHLSWLPMNLDDEGLADLVRMQKAWLEDLVRLRDENAERLNGSGETGTRIVGSIMSFGTPPGFGFADSER
jgi:hypothetical protein